MEIQQLRHLLAAAQATNYSQAAKKCFTSRQNIAHSMKVIENELEVTLFNREGSEMVLTPEGRRIVRQASEIVARIDELRVMFVEAEALALPLNLAVGTNLIAGLPAGGAELIAQHHGGVRLSELSCEECYRHVCSGKVDAALVMCMEQDFPNCNAFEVAGSMSYALTSASSSLSRLTHVSIEDLANQQLLLMSEDDFQYKQLFAGFEALGTDRVDVSVISSTSSMLHLVKRTGAVGIVSEKFAARPPEGTVVVPVLDGRLNWHFYLLYRERTSSARSALKLGHSIQQLFHGNDGGGGGSPRRPGRLSRRWRSRAAA